MNIRGLMKQETTRRLRLIEELYYTKDLLSSEQLIEILNCSLPALIGDVHFLNDQALPLKIIKTKGFYSIEFEPHATIDAIYAYILNTSLEFQVIESLFFEKYPGIQLSAKSLNCSFSNMQRYLKSIQKELHDWGFQLYHRPLRFDGDEAMIRQFYYHFFKESRKAFANYGFSQELVTAIDQLIRQIMKNNRIVNNMSSHFQLMHSFLIGLQRTKTGHFMQGLAFDCGLVIPTTEELERLSKLIKRETSLAFTDIQLRECLWPLFSHQLLLNRSQQSFVRQQNKQLTNFYENHQFLLERVSELLSVPLSQTEMTETTRLLGNELFGYYPNKRPIEIIQEVNRTMLKLIDKKYSREVRKLTSVVSDFLPPQQRNTFVSLYVRLLITTVDNILQRLVAADRPLKVLLLSDTSTTLERFWHSLFPNFISGAIQYDYFENPFILQEQLTSLTKQYDLILTNVTMSELKPACPLIAVNMYPTPKEIERIQQFINHYEPLTSRKERYHELTSTT